MRSAGAHQIGRLLCVSLSGPELTTQERDLLARLRPGGVILFARNCQRPGQVRALTDEARALLGEDALVAIDQEGGRVDRLRAFLPPMPSAAVTAERGGAEAVATLGALTARALRLLGFNLNFAPVLDVLAQGQEGLGNGLETRTFGPSPETVSACATAYLGALQAGGIGGCVKHFPGLGAASVDPHEQLPVVTSTADELKTQDLAPFREAISLSLARAVMVSHAAYTGLGERAPASLSQLIVGGLLREELGFEGVSVTDDLAMGAVKQAAGETARAARLAVAAGQDLLLLCASLSEVEKTHTALTQAAAQGEIPEARVEQSLARIESLRATLAEPPPFDARQFEEVSDQITALRVSLGLPTTGI